MTTADAPVLSLRGRVGLLAAVPGLLGFTPHESLVMLCLTGSPARVGPVLRVDLSAPEDATVARLGWHAGRFGQAIAAIAYSSAPSCPPLLSALLAEVGRKGVAVRDAVLVYRGLAAEVDCRGLVDWPNARPVPDRTDCQVDAVRTAVALTGRQVLTDRAAVERSISPPTGAAAREARDAVDRAAGRVIALLESVGGGSAGALRRRIDDVAASAYRLVYGDPAGLDPAAELAVLTQDAPTRDHLIGRVVSETTHDWVSPLVAVARAMPDPAATGVLAVLAVAAYHRGDGALAQVSLDRCLAAEPGHRLAHLMRSAIASGLTPAQLAQLADPATGSLSPGTA